MSRFYLLIFMCIISSAAQQSLHAQNSGNCKEIKVEVKVTGNNIYLDFAQDLDYKDFKLFLFAKKRDSNKLDITAKEITDLPGGTYLLVIQEKSGDRFCPKEINLKIE